MPKLAHIILSVSNWEKSKGFYDKLMEAVGFEVGLSSEKDGFGLREYNKDGHSLMLQHEGQIEHQDFVRYPGLNHIALFVDKKEKVDEVFKVTETLGTKITRKPKDYPDYGDGYYAFYFRDPDGIPLEVCYYTE